MLSVICFIEWNKTENYIINRKILVIIKSYCSPETRLTGESEFRKNLGSKLSIFSQFVAQ